MKALFRPLYLFIAASVIILALVLYFFWGGSSKSIKSSSIRIARDPTWAPLDLDDKMQRFTAFTDELLGAFARQNELRIQLSEDAPGGYFSALLRGADDAIVTADMPPAYISAPQFLYSNSIYDFGTVVVVREDFKASDLDDLKGRIVGIVRATPVPSSLGIEPAMLIVSYDSPLDALGRLIDHRIDGVLMPYIKAFTLSEGLFKGQVRIATTPIISKPVRLVTLRNTAGQQLIDEFNKSLKLMREDGTYDLFLQHWDIPDPAKIVLSPSPEGKLAG